MTEAKFIDDKAHKLADEAFSIITRQKFDYFESEEDANANLTLRAHSGEATGYINSLDIEKTEQGYLKTPRDYDSLAADLVIAFEALSFPDTQPFLHADSYGMTAGLTNPQMNKQTLAVTPDAPSCSLQIAATDIVRYSFAPKQSHNGFESVPAGVLSLPLGRHLPHEHSSSGEWFFVINELIDRDWERALVVGPAAVEAFIKKGGDLTIDEALTSSKDRAENLRSALTAMAAGFIYAGEAYLKLT